MKEFQVGLLKRAQGMVVHLTYGRGGTIVTAIVTDCSGACRASAAYRMCGMETVGGIGPSFMPACANQISDSPP
jgi:hypothetical protein